MIAPKGMVATDGRVMLANELDELDELAIIPREIRIGGETLRSDDRANLVRSKAREATGHRRSVQVLPPRREDFLPVYQELAERHEHIISVHLMEAFDAAAREARICRQLMQPTNQVHVYEAKTLEGGLEFLLRTAMSLAAEGATATQLLTLLRYLETHMLTFLLATGACSSQPWARVSGVQVVRSLLPATETLFFFDPKTGKLQAISQASELHAQIGPLLSQRWAPLRYRVVARFRGYSAVQLERLRESLLAAGVPEPAELQPVAASFLAGFPQQFVELLFLPTEADLRRLCGLVQDLVWWKGAS